MSITIIADVQRHFPRKFDIFVLFSYAAFPSYRERLPIWLAQTKKTATIWYTIGYHTADHSPAELSYLLQMAAHECMVGIGECGCDYKQVMEDQALIRDLECRHSNYKCDWSSTVNLATLSTSSEDS